MKQDHDETTEGLAPDAAAFLDSVRDLDEPTAADRHRVRRRVLATVAAAGAASAAGGTATAAAATAGGASTASIAGGALSVKIWIGVAVGLVGAGVAGGVATLADEPAAEVAARSDSAPGARPSASGDRRAAETSDRPPEWEEGARPLAPESADRPLATAPALGVSPSASELESETAPRERPPNEPRQGVPQAAPGASAEREAPTPPEDSQPPSAETLAEELDLIRRAHAASNGGDPLEALRILGLHGQRFPNGSLAIEREGARATALCQAGREEEGRRAAERFLTAHPSSPLRARVSRACAD